MAAVMYNYCIDRRGSRRCLLVFGHLFRQPRRFLLHLVITPRLSRVVIDSRKPALLLFLHQLRPGRPLLLAQLLIQIRILALQHVVYSIRAPLLLQIVLPPWYNMRMHMRDALPRIHAVLDRNIERRRIEDSLYHARHLLRRQEQVLHLGGRQVVEARDDAARRDEDMAGQEGLEIDDCEGQTR
jgi:hypothetical protein